MANKIIVSDAMMLFVSVVTGLLVMQIKQRKKRVRMIKVGKSVL